MMDSTSAWEALEAALSTGGDFAEIFWEDRRDQNLVLQDNRLETILSGRNHGAGIRVYVGLNAVYTYTNDTTRDGLVRCARQAAAAVKSQRAGLVQAQKLVEKQIANAHVIRMLPSETDTRKRSRFCGRPTRRLARSARKSRRRFAATVTANRTWPFATATDSL